MQDGPHNCEFAAQGELFVAPVIVNVGIYGGRLGHRSTYLPASFEVATDFTKWVAILNELTQRCCNRNVTGDLFEMSKFNVEQLGNRIF